MLKTSEWVSLGHPDKIADYISCYLLDCYLDRTEAGSLILHMETAKVGTDFSATVRRQ